MRGRGKTDGVFTRRCCLPKWLMVFPCLFYPPRFPPPRHVRCRHDVTSAAAVTSRPPPPPGHVRCRRHVKFAAAATSRSLPPPRHVRRRRLVTFAAATRHVRCRRHVRSFVRLICMTIPRSPSLCVIELYAGIRIGFSIVVHGSCCVYIPPYIDAPELFTVTLFSAANIKTNTVDSDIIL